MAVSLRVGIIGVGNIVESNHLPVLLNLNGIEVSWIFDKSSKRGSLISSMFELPTVSELVPGISEVDICLLTIPYGARRDYMDLLGESGKALYVEKPFALTMAEHLSWGEKFHDSKLAVGFQRRYYKIVRELRELVRCKQFGKLNRICFTQGSFSLKGGTGYLSNAQLSGGGVIIESAIHYLDQILFITDAIDLSVVKTESITRSGLDYDTRFKTELKLKEVTVEVDAHVSTLQNLDNGLEFHFENAIVATSLSVNGKIMILRDGGGVGFEMQSMNCDSQVYSTSVTGAFGGFWRSFVQSVKTGVPNDTSFRSSLLTTKWVEGLYGGIK